MNDSNQSVRREKTMADFIVQMVNRLILTLSPLQIVLVQSIEMIGRVHCSFSVFKWLKYHIQVGIIYTILDKSQFEKPKNQY